MTGETLRSWGCQGDGQRGCAHRDDPFTEERNEDWTGCGRRTADCSLTTYEEAEFQQTMTRPLVRPR